MQINFDNFLEKEIPLLHPKSVEYQEYWKEQIRRIIEGYWCHGTWMPPSLYFYLNFGTIFLKKGKSKTQIKGRPLFSDVLLEKHYLWTEARGLSGFERQRSDNIRSFLQNTSADLGRPLYENNAKNLFIMTQRGQGKSFDGANIAAHEFLTDGRKIYTPGEKIADKAEILIGAYDAKYSIDLCSKIKLTLENLPGGIEINSRYYPSPISKRLSGSWAPSKSVEHYYKKKVGGTWIFEGTRSVIKHRTYKDNPFAAQGGRNTIKIAEEVGMWDNLLESYYADEYTQKIGNEKFGSTLFQGTGGDISGGGSIAAQKMFFDPEAYDCLAFEDKYENKGLISFFVPATYGKLDYKDELGYTNFKLAEETETKEREKKKKAKDSNAFSEYVIYNPMVPSEIFLSRSFNIFPVFQISERLSELENNKKYLDGIWKGTLEPDLNGELQWKEDKSLKPIFDYPLDRGKDSKDGCITIFVPPIKDERGEVPHGRYISGLDPYDQDEAQTSASLGSFFIYDRWTDDIVCEYTGRPQKTTTFYENVRRLIKYYSAPCLYENMLKGFFNYMDTHNESYLLYNQPNLIKDMIQETMVKREKGIHMTTGIKIGMLHFINNWLRDSAEDPEFPGKLNVHKIKSIPLLKELLFYNDEGNFDRVISFGLCLILRQEMIKFKVKEESSVLPLHQSSFFNKPLFKQSQGISFLN